MTLTPSLIKDIAERAEKATDDLARAIGSTIDWLDALPNDVEFKSDATRYASMLTETHRAFGVVRTDIPALLAHITALEKERDEARAAVQKTHDELYWCAEQLKHHGRPGRPGDSVSVALDAAKAVIRKSRAALQPKDVSQ